MSLLNIHKFVCTPSHHLRKFLSQLKWEEKQLKELKSVLSEDIDILTKKRNKNVSDIDFERRNFKNLTGMHNYRNMEKFRLGEKMERFDMKIINSYTETIKSLRKDLIKTRNKLQMLKKEEKILSDDIGDIETLIWRSSKE